MSRLLRIATVGVAALVLLSQFSTAFAQGQPRGQRGFGGGMGGPGGGNPAMMWGRLLQAEAVQKDLELVDDQKAKLKEISDKAMAKMRESFSGMGNLRDLSDDERKTKMDEMRKKGTALAEETKKEIEGVLLAHQLERLKEIVIQVQGTGALSSKDVQTALGLTADQLEKMTKVRDGAMEKTQGLMGDMTGLSREDRQAKMQEMRPKMDEIRKQAEADVLGVLTADQKEKFEKMKGAKIEIDMQSLMQRGPRGGRGGPDAEKK
jgi:Spy/CpxP family protein refolding chaperone